MRHTLEFIAANATGLTPGRITSTARKGPKWLKAKPGDLLSFLVTGENETFGEGVVVNVVKTTLEGILATAQDNHANKPAAALEDDLKAAYGDMLPSEVFVKLSFIVTTRDPCEAAAIAAFESEREYQERLKACSENYKGGHEIPAFLNFMDDYLKEAQRISARDWSAQCGPRTLEVIRKVGGLAMACLEEHGAPLRVMPSAVGIAERVAKAV